MLTGYSTARPPGNPGDQLYELDTGNTMVYQTPLTGWTKEWSTPWGPLAVTSTTSNAGPLSLATVFVALNTTVTIIGNRIIKLTFSCDQVTGTVVNDAFGIDFLRDSTVISGSFGGVLNIDTTSTTQFPDLWFRDIAPAAGQHTWTVQATRVAGTGTATFTGANVPIRFMVEDMGPAGPPL